MKVRVPMMVDDGRFAPLDRPDLIEGFDIDREDAFFDGPASTRVAVVDRDDRTGEILPGAEFLPPRKGRILGTYKGAYPVDVTSRVFNQVSVFATVLKTIYMFEEPDTLGRRVRWAFASPQLMIVPRAGTLRDAYYSRELAGLLFHSFPNPRNPRETVHTSLARDIVAHETGHAVLDGIAPHLWDAITPESLALQEAIADLTALLVSLRSRKLIQAVLRKTGGSIEHSTHFSALAEEFGFAVGAGALRDLKNDLTMDDVRSGNPHELSQPLSGALYSVLVSMHEGRKQQAAERRGQSEYSASGYALYGAAQHLKRMALRALDYLPPGEVSFADYGRAILAADQASHPADPREREWLVAEFVRRGIVSGAGDLEVSIPAGASELVRGLDLAAIVRSDRASAEFAESEMGRRLLGVTPDAQVRVEPRAEVTKVSYHRRASGVLDTVSVTECVFKVSWRQTEPTLFGPVPYRSLVVGSTLVWDCSSGQVRALLTSDHRLRPAEDARQRAGRDDFVRSLLLHPQEATRAVEVLNGVMYVSTGGRPLHGGREPAP